MKFEYYDWLILLSNNAISGDLKIECIKKYLSMYRNAREQIVILNELQKVLKSHVTKREMDHSAYKWLENHYPDLEKNPSTLSNKTDWEDKIERPLKKMFENFEMKFCYENSLEHKNAVIKNYKNWDILFHDDCFIKVLDFVNEKIKILEKTKGASQKVKEEKDVSNNYLTFGFKGDVAKLKLVVNQLCRQIELLNEDESSQDVLMNVFTTKEISPGAVKIRLGCETKHFRYCIDKWMPYFTSLTLANIERSKIFYSQRDTRITSNNLSASSSKHKIEPKRKTAIDKIFEHLK
jgi:hypothetical protein